MTTNFLKSVSSINWLRPFSAVLSWLPRQQRRQGASVAAGFMLCLVVSGPAVAGPEGGVIRAGDGTITEQGLLTLIRQNSDRLAIDWETFNLAANETVRFIQPGETSVALNRIFDQNPSQIFGVIEANGRVVLINPNGMLFGETAQLNVAGLVASSLSISVDDFMSGNYTLEGSGEGGLILNQGTINADYVALIGEAVANEGLIVADAGVVHLAAGRKVAIDFDGGGLMFFESDSEILSSALDVDAAVSNNGTIIADGGRVLLTADAARDVYSQAVNNSGLIQARRIDNTGGVIRLSGGAGDTINSGTLDASGDADSDGGSVHVLGQNVGLIGDAVVDASGGRNGGEILIGGAFQGGDASIENSERTYVGSGVRLRADAGVVGDGGSVIVWADDITRYFGTITARGGTDGGNGGFAEVSGANTLNFRGMVDLSARWGSTGTLLLDPAELRILGGNGGGGGDLDNNILPPGPTAEILFGDSTGDDAVTAAALEAQTADILLQATDRIIVEDQNLNGGDGSIDLGADVSLTMETRNNGGDSAVNPGISFDDPTNSIIASGNGSITLTAGTIGAQPADLTNIGNLITDTGNVNLNAANDIDLDGSITTTSGTVNLTADGSIDVNGDINGGGDVNIRVDANDTSDERLLLLGAVTAGGTATLAGGATGDTLQGSNGTNTWSVDGANTGQYNGATWSGFENLTGGDGVDNFTINDVLSGAIQGGLQNDTFALNAGGSAGDIFGGGGIDTLTATVANETITIDNVNAGNIDGGQTFSGVESVDGGGGNDIFNITSTLTNTASGGDGDDIFNVTGVGSVGDFNGGDGTDQVSYAGNVSSQIFEVDNFVDIESLTGTGGLDTLYGSAGTDVITIDGNNEGDVGGTLNFFEIENVDGRDGNDRITLTSTGSLNGEIFGGGGIDTLTAGGDNDLITVDGTNSGNVDGQIFSGVESVDGGGGNDVFTITGTLTNTASGGDGDDVFNVNGNGSVGAFNGGDGTDQVSYALNNSAQIFDLDDLTGIESLTGSAFADTLRGTGGTDVFTIDGVNSGDVGGTFTFAEIENVDGEGGNDSFTLDSTGSISSIAGGDGSDTVIGDSVAGNAFVINSANTGTVNGTGFNGIENLTGGGATDIFTFNVNDNGGLTTVDGLGGTDTATWAGAGPVTVGIGAFANVESLVGSGNAGDTLQGDGSGSAFIIDGLNSGTADGINFDGFENLAGLGGNDSFTLSGGTVTSIAGGGGTDTLNGEDAGNNFTINAANAGDVDGIGFTGIDNLVGGTGTDVFAFTVNDDGGLNTVDGAGGNDEVNYTGAGGPVTVAINRFANIETLRGSGNAGDTLQGTNAADAFSVDGVNSGVANGISYFDFENLDGLGGNDNFTLNVGGSVASINGGGGNDTITGLSTGGNVFVVTTQNVGTANGIAFTEIDNLTGGSGADTFTFNALLDGVANGGAGDDTFTLNAGGEAGGGYVGGAGNDEIVGNDSGNTFAVNAPDAGQVNGRDFSEVEALTGGAGNDVFTFNDALSGAATGGAGDDIFNLNAGGSAGSLDGGAGNDEIDGDDAGNFFVVSAADAGTANGTAFSNVENLTGGGGADTFTLNSALSGSVDAEGGDDIIDLTGGGSAASYDGGAGTDTLIGNAGPNTFNVTANSAGDLNGVGFNNMENLTGGTGADTFNFNAALGGTATGGAGDDIFNVNDGGSAFFYDGGAGSDTLSYAGQSAGVTINTSESDAIESIVGSNFDDVINLSGDRSSGVSIDGAGGSNTFAVSGDSTVGGDLSVTNVDSATIDANVTANNITLNVGGTITQSGGVIAGQVLTTTSIGGQDILGDVVAFDATNTGGGDIVLSNASGLDVAGVSQSGGGSVDIDSDGDMSQSGNVSSDGGNISVTANDGSLTMVAGTTTTSNGGDIDYSNTGTGGDVTIGSLRTCIGVVCAAGDTGEVTITSFNGDILSAQTGTVNVTSDTAILTAQGDIGTPGNRFVFDGMLIDFERITLNFSGQAFVDSRGILFATNNFAGVDDISDARRETAASAQAAALDEDTTVDWAAYSEDITVYEINNEGVNQPQAEEDDDFAKLNDDEAEAPIPLSQVSTR